MTRTVLPLLALAAALPFAPAAHAAPFTLTTTGTINTGSDSSNTFGSANNLAGQAFTLSLTFAGLGGTTVATPGTFDTSGSIPGSLAITIEGHRLTAPIANSYAAFVEETGSEIYASNDGDDGNGNFIAVTNAFTTGTALPADLSTSFTRQATGANGANFEAVSFSLSGALANVSFQGTPTTAAFAVPEPASMALLAAGLGIAGWRRRRA